MIFQDRAEAGRVLAQALSAYANRRDVIVLALPRGGVPVAFEVAQTLHVPLDIFLVRKLGVPGQEELAMGAIASGGMRVFNTSVLRNLHIPQEVVESVIATEQQELERREELYRGGQIFPDLHNRTVILIDDGLATGATMYAATKAVRQLHPARLIVAVPVAVEEICEQFRAHVDEIICAETPKPFDGVGRWYKDFSQTTDEEVRDLLHRVNEQQASVSQERKG